MMIFLSLVCAMRFYVFAFTAALGLPHVFLIAMVPVRYIYYKYQIIIFVFLINFAVHSFSHQAQPELRRVLIEMATTVGRNATPSIPSAFTFGNTFRMIW